MAPFRWSSTMHDIALAREAVGRNPRSSHEWDQIAEILSKLFSTPVKPVDIKGRVWGERLDRHIYGFSTTHYTM